MQICPSFDMLLNEQKFIYLDPNAKSLKINRTDRNVFLDFLTIISIYRVV